MKRIKRRLAISLEALVGSQLGAVLVAKVGTAFIVYLLGAVLAFALQVLLARTLGVDGFGQYIVVLTCVTLLVIPGKLGLDTAALRLLPAYEARGQWRRLRGFNRWSSAVCMVMSCVICMMLLIVVRVFESEIQLGLGYVFLCGSPLIPLIALLTLNGTRLQAFRFVFEAQFPQLVVKPAVLCACLLLLTLLLKESISAAMAMILNVASTLGVLALTLRLSRKKLPPQWFGKSRTYESKSWAKLIGPMLVITSGNAVIGQLDILLVGFLANPTDAGIYAAASRIAAVLPMAIIMVNTIAAPVMAQLYAVGEIRRLQRMLTVITRGALLVAVPLFLFIVLAREGLLMLFGSEFVAGSAALVVLATGKLLIAVAGTVGYLLSMTGNERAAATWLGIGVAVSLIAGIVLIPRFSMMGAAWASLLSTVVWVYGMLNFAVKRIGVEPVRVWA